MRVDDELHYVSRLQTGDHIIDLNAASYLDYLPTMSNTVVIFAGILIPMVYILKSL